MAITIEAHVAGWPACKTQVRKKENRLRELGIAHRCGECRPVDLQALPPFRVNQTDIFESNPERSEIPTWPTPSGITEQQARNHCQSALQTAQLYAHCSSKADLIRISMTDCVMDILLTDRYNMVEASLAAFTDSCQVDLIRRINNGNPQLNSTVTSVCAISCFRHGSCLNGRCVCNQGYTGSSCQLRAAQAPRLLRIEGSAACDANQQSCQVFMEAEGFEDSDNFYCRVAEQSVSGVVSTVRAVFITDARLACTLPEGMVKSNVSVKTFAVSITYDGSLYSNALRVTVFDSKCQDCDSTGCRRKTGTCLINNVCYRDGDVNPRNAAETCDPAQSTTWWSSKGNQTCMSDVVLSAPLDGARTCSCYFRSSAPTFWPWFYLTWLVDGMEWRYQLIFGTAFHTANISMNNLPPNARNLTCRVAAVCHEKGFLEWTVKNSGTIQIPWRPIFN